MKIYMFILVSCTYFTLHSVYITVCLMLCRTYALSMLVAVTITPARPSVM